MSKYTIIQILDNLSKRENVLRLVLAMGLLLPYFTRPQQATALSDTGTDYDEAQALRNSADPATYLPPAAQLPFQDSEVASPFDFLNEYASSNPFDMMPSFEQETAGTDPASSLLDFVDETAAPLDEQIETEVEEVEERSLFERIGNWFVAEDELTEPPIVMTHHIFLPTINSAGIVATQPDPIPDPTPLPVSTHVPTLNNNAADPDFVYQSPDDKVTLTLQAHHDIESPAVTYQAINLQTRSSLAQFKDRGLNALFKLDVVDGSESITWLSRDAKIDVQYVGLSDHQAADLKLYGYDQERDIWFDLPTSINTANRTVTAKTSLLSTFALALAPNGADIDPCAEVTPLIAENEYPNDIMGGGTHATGWDEEIPQNVPHPLVALMSPGYIVRPTIFTHIRGTDAYLSSDPASDTIPGTVYAGDPYTSQPLHTMGKAEMTMTYAAAPGIDPPINSGPWLKDMAAGDFPTPTLPDQDITEYLPILSSAVVGNTTIAPDFVDVTIDPITLEYEVGLLSGTRGYYIVRADVQPPDYVSVETYHDGAGGVRITVEATDNCAVQGIAVVAQTTSGGSVTASDGGLMTYTSDSGSGMDNGVGFYEILLNLETTGTNTYNLILTDMAHYDPADPNHPVPLSMTEPATDQEGAGMPQKCESDGCGCTGDTCGWVGDPVSTASGNFVMQVVDAMVAGVGDTMLDIIRSYNSSQSQTFPSFVGPVYEPVGIFGQGWSSPFKFEVELVSNLPGVGPGVKVIYPDGRSARYAGLSGTLAPVTPGEVNLVTVSGGNVTIYDIQTLKTYTFQAPVVPTPAQSVVSAQIVKEEDANGNWIEYTQGAYGPISIKNSANRELILNYLTVTDANGVSHGLLQQITGPEGLNITYTYDQVNLLLESVNDSRNQTTEYVYETGTNKLIEIISPKGHDSMTLSYYADGRVQNQTIGATESYTFAYDDIARVHTVTDSLGNTETHSYDGVDRITSIQDGIGYAESFTHTADDYRSAKDTKNSNAYAYGYDAAGNMTTVTGPNGYNVTYTYTSLNRPQTIIDSEGRTTAFAYDGAGNMTSITNDLGDTMTMGYNGDGQPTTITDYNGNVINMTYDPTTGDLASVTNGEGETVNFGYDDLGRMSTMTTHEGNPFAFEYDIASDLITKVSGPLGYEIAYTYDANGNIETETDARGNVTTYAFDGSENLVTVVDALANVTTFAYDAMNNLASVTDAEMHTTSYVYDGVYNLTAINAPEGRTTLFEYDGESNITKITDGEGRDTELVYDGRNRLTDIIDPLNNTTTLTYDKVDNITSINDANTHVTTYEYDNLDRLIKETNPEGEETEYTYDPNGNLTEVEDAEEHVTKLVYDAADRMISIENAENELVEFEYDSLGNIVKLTQPNGVPVSWVYDALYRPTTLIQNATGGAADSETNVTYQFEYDLNGNLTEVTDPNLHTSTFAYDELNRLETDTNGRSHAMTYAYDKVGNLVAVTNRRGFATELIYDDADRLIEVKDAAGNSSFYDYDLVDNLTSYKDENGHTVTMTYDDLDRLAMVVNPEGDDVQFAYDDVGNLLTFTDARGNPTTFEYDTADRMVKTTDAAGGVTQLVYDDVGNVVQVVDANGHPTDIVYDDVYRTVAVTEYVSPVRPITTAFEYDVNGNVIKVTDAEGQLTTITYDALDRIASVTNAESETTQFTYDPVGNLLRTIEADDSVPDAAEAALPDGIDRSEGTVKLYHYDEINQLVGVTLNETGTGDVLADNVRYTYAYDENGNLIEIIDPYTHTTKFTYDGLDRVSNETNPLGNEWDYVYDAVGNLIERTDGNRHTTTYTYYKDDQLQAIDYNDGRAPVQFTYDENNNMTQMTDWLGTTTMVYDVLNRVTAVDDALDRELHYAYDAVGNVTKMTYPNGTEIAYTYTDNDWLASMEELSRAPGDTQITTYTRNDVGQMVRSDRSNGAITEATYDNAHRLLSMAHWEDGKENLIQRTTYTLNEVGLRTEAHSEYGRPYQKVVTESYTYDGLQRLTRVEDSNGFDGQYTYDRVGNRISWFANDDQTTIDEWDGFFTIYTYNEANQLETADKDNGNVITTFTYDDNGNRINKLEDEAGHPYHYGTDYEYDRADRLTSVENYRLNQSLEMGDRRNREETTMDYDGMGRRLVKTYTEHDGRGRVDQSEYVFDGLDIVAEYPIYEEGEELGRDNHRNEFYLDDTRQIVTQRRFPNGVAAQTYQYHSDGRRDVVSLTDETNRAWVHYDYDAYGQQLPEWGNSPHPEYRGHNQFTFSGQLHDENNDLSEYYSRIYDPTIASWESTDNYRGNLKNPRTGHRYKFIHSDPINHFDRFGESAESFSECSTEDCTELFVKKLQEDQEKGIFCYGPGSNCDYKTKVDGDKVILCDQYYDKGVLGNIGLGYAGQASPCWNILASPTVQKATGEILELAKVLPKKVPFGEGSPHAIKNLILYHHFDNPWDKAALDLGDKLPSSLDVEVFCRALLDAGKEILITPADRDAHIDAIIDSVKDFGEDVTNRVEDGLEDLRDLGNSTVEGAKKIGGQIKDGAKELGGQIKDGAKKAGNSVKNGAKKVGGSLKNGANKVKGWFD